MPPSLTIWIPIRPSRTIASVLVASHVVAAIAVLVARIPTGFAVFLLLLVGASAAWQRRLSYPEGLSLQADGRFAFHEVKEGAMTLDPSSNLIGPLAVLRHANGGHMQTTVLARDCFACDEDSRRFRRWLRWQASVANTLTDRG